MSKLKTVSPIDGRLVAERPLAEAAEIAAAVERARLAQREWRHVSIAERAATCTRMVDAFVARTDEIAEEITLGRWGGRSRRRTRRGQGIRGAGTAHARRLPRPQLADIVPSRTTAGLHAASSAAIRVGVVFVTIAPWNYPYLTAVNAVVPASGRRQRGDPQAIRHRLPLCAERFAEAFAAADLPDGVFQYLHLQPRARRAPGGRCIGEAGERRFRRLHRFGRPPVTRFSAPRRAKRFIGAGLELGGKDPAYVRADADLDAFAVENLVDGAFFNSGQSCCGIERILRPPGRLDGASSSGFAELTQPATELGNPLEQATTSGRWCGPDRAADFVRGQVEPRPFQTPARPPWSIPAAVPADDGGRTLHGTPGAGGRRPRMRVMTEESFGPVVGIMRCPRRRRGRALDERQPLRPHRLGLDPRARPRPWRSAIRGSRRARVFMNRCDYLDPALAWTGVKDSGRGCTLSRVGYESLTRPKSYPPAHRADRRPGRLGSRPGVGAGRPPATRGEERKPRLEGPRGALEPSRAPSLGCGPHRRLRRGRPNTRVDQMPNARESPILGCGE